MRNAAQRDVTVSPAQVRLPPSALTGTMSRRTARASRNAGTRGKQKRSRSRCRSPTFGHHRGWSVARNVPRCDLRRRPRCPLAVWRVKGDYRNSEDVVAADKGDKPLCKEGAPVFGAAHSVNPVPFLIGDSQGAGHLRTVLRRGALGPRL